MRKKNTLKKNSSFIFLVKIEEQMVPCKSTATELSLKGHNKGS